MKNIFALLMIGVIVLSCKNEPKHKVAPAHESNKDLNETKNTIAATFSSTEAKQLYNDYLNLKAALVNTDFEKSRKEANTLAKNLEGKAAYKNIQMVASLIVSSKTIEKQREFFVGLNEQTTTVLKAAISSGKIYQQYCPMAFDGKGGYWLSNSDEVRNPYFGDVMLVCGEVTKELE